MEVEKENIKCDLCDWKQQIDFADIPKWHNKKCPECGNGIIVNDKDLQVWGNIELLLKIQDMIDPDKKIKRSTIHIDTAPMREGKELKVSNLAKNGR